MIGDPLIIAESDYVRAQNIFDKSKDNNIVLIGGGSGTKKSECAYAFQKILYDKKKSSFVVSLDDYYVTHATIRNENRKKQGIDSVGLSEMDWHNLERIYEDFRDAKEIHFKRVHRFLDTVEYNVIDSEEIDFLIIEGLYANYLRKSYSDNLSVYLEGNPVQTLEFRKLRGKENENDPFRERVVQKEYNVVVQLKRYADLILEFKGE
jgi:uridine kinase